MGFPVGESVFCLNVARWDSLMLTGNLYFCYYYKWTPQVFSLFFSLSLVCLNKGSLDIFRIVAFYLLHMLWILCIFQFLMSITFLTFDLAEFKFWCHHVCQIFMHLERISSFLAFPTPESETFSLLIFFSHFLLLLFNSATHLELIFINSIGSNGLNFFPRI